MHQSTLDKCHISSYLRINFYSPTMNVGRCDWQVDKNLWKSCTFKTRPRAIKSRTSSKKIWPGPARNHKSNGHVQVLDIQSTGLTSLPQEFTKELIFFSKILKNYKKFRKFLWFCFNWILLRKVMSKGVWSIECLKSSM